MYYINPYGVCNGYSEFSLHIVSFYFVSLFLSLHDTSTPLWGGGAFLGFTPLHNTGTLYDRPSLEKKSRSLSLPNLSPPLCVLVYVREWFVHGLSV